MNSGFLPISLEEIKKRGWESVDIIIVSGDAYVDHPSFGHAMIARLAENEGLKVAILPQPNWRDDLRDFKKLGKPNLFFGVTAGCMDSMVNHYTAFKRLRSTDAYTPGNVSGFRPDYASIVYSRILKKLFPDVPVILGGVEASLRRFTHYDYWSDSLKPSILVDSGADLLVYGSGILPMLDVITHFKNNGNMQTANSIRQTSYLSAVNPAIDQQDIIQIPSHDECLKSKTTFAQAFVSIEKESNRRIGRTLVQKQGDKFLVVNPPNQPMTQEELDKAYNLPYMRLPHPRYLKRGPVPAYEMIKYSVNTHVGCFGGCSFCSIAMHQGKFVSSRSVKSITNEIKEVIQSPGFTGYISDLGGPSANMFRMEGIKLQTCNTCQRVSCIFPNKCTNLNDNHQPLIELYREVRKMNGIKKVFINSGLRYDMFIDKQADEDKKNAYSAYFKELVTHHVSGRLKVAPEHTSDEVLKIMRKPGFSVYFKLKKQFEEISKQAGLKQEIIPYFISSHPGCTMDDMLNCALETKKANLRLEQVQDLTPTPMTLSSVMYYTGLNPYTGKKIFVPKTADEKRLQHMMFFWYKKENKPMLIQWLKKNQKQHLADKLLK